MLGGVTTRSSRARILVWVGPFVSLALVPAGAQAAGAADTASTDSPNFALEWAAPAGCPSREQMEIRIARLVGERTHARETVHARAQVATDGVGALRGDVELMTSAQQISRHVEGDSCASVADALALIIALAIEPEPAPIVPEPAAGPPTVDAPPMTDDASSRRFLFVSAAARFDVDSLPAPSFGGEVALGWDPGHVDLELGAAVLAPSRATLPTRPNQGADVRLTDLGVRGCYELFDAPVDIGPCAGLHARWTSAHGFGSSGPHDVTAVLGVTSIGALAKARLSSRISLRVSAEAAVPLARPSFQIDSAEVFRTPAFAFRTAVAAALLF